jgi:hypothetical protein
MRGAKNPRVVDAIGSTIVFRQQQCGAILIGERVPT